MFEVVENLNGFVTLVHSHEQQHKDHTMLDIDDKFIENINDGHVGVNHHKSFLPLLVVN